MNRDVGKQSRPGAGVDLEADHEPVGKTTRAGRLGGDHGPTAAPPAAPAAAPAAPVKKGPLKITSETQAAAPVGPNTRTTVGVGETVTFTGTESGDWTASGGKTLSDAAGVDTFRWSAPGTPGAFTIKLTVDKKVATKTIVVVAPSSITFKKAGDMSFGGQGAGMYLDMDLGPKSVSFGAVTVKEKPGPASGVWGYFQKKAKAGEDLSHHPSSSPTTVNDDNTLNSQDEAFFGDWDAPYSPGGLTWVIPHLYALADDGGDGKQFTTVTQSMTIADKKGTSVVTKGGQTAKRTP